MPPAALNSSIHMSAATFAGAPSTEAEPVMKVLMPSLSSAGRFCCAIDVADSASRAAPTPRILASDFMVCLLSLQTDNVLVSE
ncbi:hypothetical protein D3C72_2037800 [compost metagenome]